MRPQTMNNNVQKRVVKVSKAEKVFDALLKDKRKLDRDKKAQEA